MIFLNEEEKKLWIEFLEAALMGGVTFPISVADDAILALRKRSGLIS